MRPTNTSSIRCWSVPGRCSYRPTMTTDARNSAQDSQRSEEHTSELQSLMRISYAVIFLKKKNKTTTNTYTVYRIMMTLSMQYTSKDYTEKPDTTTNNNTTFSRTHDTKSSHLHYYTQNTLISTHK